MFTIEFCIVKSLMTFFRTQPQVINNALEVGPGFGSWAEGWKAISENSYT